MGSSTDCPWTVYGLSMDFPWTVHALSMGCLWSVHGLSMDCPRTVHGQSMDSPWTVHGQSVDSPWSVHGLSMDCPWTVPGLSMNPLVPPRLAKFAIPWREFSLKRAKFQKLFFKIDFLFFVQILLPVNFLVFEGCCLPGRKSER